VLVRTRTDTWFRCLQARGNDCDSDYDDDHGYDYYDFDYDDDHDYDYSDFDYDDDHDYDYSDFDYDDDHDSPTTRSSERR